MPRVFPPSASRLGGGPNARRPANESVARKLPQSDMLNAGQFSSSSLAARAYVGRQLSLETA